MAHNSMVRLRTGVGAEMYQKSIDTYSYPDGTYWKEAGI